MDNWKVKINSENCPHKVYPTWTSNSKWQKGYCKVSDAVPGIDVQCRCENCPLRVR